MAGETVGDTHTGIANVISEASFRHLAYKTIHAEVFARLQSEGLKPYVRSQPATWLERPGAHQIKVGQESFLIGSGGRLYASVLRHQSTEVLHHHWAEKAYQCADDVITASLTVERMLALAKEHGLVVASARRAKVFCSLWTGVREAIAGGERLDRETQLELEDHLSLTFGDRLLPRPPGKGDLGDVWAQLEGAALRYAIHDAMQFIRAKLLARGLFGISFDAIAGAGVAALVSQLDARGVELARRANAFGRWFDLRTYERIRKFPAVYEQIDRDRRRMLPFFDQLFAHQTATAQRAIASRPMEAMRWTRETFIGAGGTPLVWRRLYQASAPMLSTFCCAWRDASRQGFIIHLLGQPTLLPVRLLSRLSRALGDLLDDVVPEHRLAAAAHDREMLMGHALPAIVRDARRALDAGDREALDALADTLAGDLTLVRDYLADEAQAARTEPGVSWSALLERSQAWHFALEQRRRAQDRDERHAALNFSWSSAIDGYRDDDFEAVALTTGFALEEEAIAMRHCADDYVGRCVCGTSRIFSVRTLTGERVATAELTFGRGRTRATQVLGAGNQPVPDVVLAFANRLAARYKEAVKRRA